MPRQAKPEGCLRDATTVGNRRKQTPASSEHQTPAPIDKNTRPNDKKNIDSSLTATKREFASISVPLPKKKWMYSPQHYNISLLLFRINNVFIDAERSAHATTQEQKAQHRSLASLFARASTHLVGEPRELPLSSRAEDALEISRHERRDETSRKGLRSARKRLYFCQGTIILLLYGILKKKNWDMFVLNPDVPVYFTVLSAKN